MTTILAHPADAEQLADADRATTPAGRQLRAANPVPMPNTVAATPADIIRGLVERGYADPSIIPGTFPSTPVDAIVHATIDAAGPLRSAAGGWDDIDKGRSDVAFSIAVEAMVTAMRTSSNPASTARGLTVAMDMVTREALTPEPVRVVIEETPLDEGVPLMWRRLDKHNARFAWDPAQTTRAGAEVFLRLQFGDDYVEVPLTTEAGE